MGQFEEIERARVSPTVRFVAIFILVSVSRAVELAPFRLGMIFALMAIVSYMASTSQKSLFPLREYPELLCVLGIFYFAVLSIPFSAWPRIGYIFVSNTLLKVMVIFYILIKSAYTFRELKTVASVLPLSGILLLVMICLRGTATVPGRTSFGEALDPNDTAVAFVMVLPFSLAFLRYSAKSLKLLWLCSSFLLATGIIMTGSRGGFLGFLTVIIAFILGLKRQGKVGTACLLLSAMIVGGFLVPDHYWQRVGSILDPGGDYNSQSRLESWAMGLDFMLDRPFFGVGVRAFPTAYGEVLGRRKGPWYTAHNTFIQIGAETGIGGLICLVFLLLLANKRLKAMSKAGGENVVPRFLSELGAACRMSLLGFFVCSLFLSHAYFPLLYIVLAISLISFRLYSDFVRESTARRSSVTATGGRPSSAQQKADWRQLERTSDAT